VRVARPVLGGAIVVYFVIALEVLIMISPFAAFFYAAFDPVLLFLAGWPATSWLSAFFLPHMVLPPGLFLQAVRVAGSVLFVGGAIVFLACAGQVYTGKLLRRGPALSGLYRWIRHPQYLALAATGLGLTILWPRFLTVVLWTVMVGLYDLLARDEERRMVRQFGDRYREYMGRTGMFFPRPLERAAHRLPLPRPGPVRPLLGFAALSVVTVGGAFALRAYTVSRLPLETSGRVSALAILPGDALVLEHRLDAALRVPEIASRLAAAPGPVVAYLVPVHYVMQGMIANTGPQWRLYEHHQTLAMITDWILHPFRHLEGGAVAHHGMSAGSAAAPAGAASASGVRRLIFLRVGEPEGPNTRRALFAIGARRDPLFFADVDLHTLQVRQVQPLGPGTGWGRVPTPMF
jgi:protein-S-isoprenylcysteine O-methyltransferase Ste14